MKGGWLVALVLALASCAALASCGGGDAGGPDATPDAFLTICGEPGDLGNELGIGQFCNVLTDCATTVNAPLCATFGNPQAHFCTNACNPDVDAGPPPCGTAATCICDDRGCGCTPDACLE